MRNAERINQKLNEVWAEKTTTEQKPEETKKIALPPDHILNYRNKEKTTEEKQPEDNTTEEKISYIKAKEILGIQNADSISSLIWKKKLIGGGGFVTLKSVEEYKKTRLPAGGKGLMIRRANENKSPEVICYKEASEMLNLTMSSIYNLVLKKQIEGKDGFCNLKSVIAYKDREDRKVGRPKKAIKLIKPIKVECAEPDKISVPTYDDVIDALRFTTESNIVGDSYKHLKIDTVAWSKANHTTEQQKAICQFMINKYTMRQKNQDKDDIKKARFYLDWLEDLI